MAGAEGNGFTSFGWIGLIILFAGLGVSFLAIYLSGKSDKLVEQGPHGRVDLRPSDDPSPIVWMENPYRNQVLRLERQCRMVAAPSVAFFLVSYALFFMGLNGQLGDAIWVILSVFASVIASSAIALWAVSTGFQRQSSFTPVRVGISSNGIHSDYDLLAVAKKPLPTWALTYAPWKEVASLSSPSGGSSTHQVSMQRVGGGRWSLINIETSIVAQIQAAWDSGTQLPLA